MIVVTGASGQLGRLVVEALLRRGLAPASIVAAVRQPTKAADLAALGVQVREADYERPATLDAAFAGAERVLLVSSSEFGRRQPQHQAAVDAAVRQRVGQLVYTSLLKAANSPLAQVAADHAATESMLRSSGLRHTVLRNGWYHENYLHSLTVGLERGVFIGASAQGRIASAARADYAEAAAAVLTAAIVDAQTLELAGDTAYTLHELAALASAAAGRPLAYQDLPPAAFEQAMLDAGLPPPFAAVLTSAEVGAAQDGLFDGSGTLSRLIGRPTTPMAALLAQTFGAANKP
jgi:NAD(P)H dehydrogenase (quinone)